MTNVSAVAARWPQDHDRALALFNFNPWIDGLGIDLSFEDISWRTPRKARW